MQLPNDDEVAEIDNIWLGPARWTFMWHARYSAYIMGFCLMVLSLTIERRVGIHASFWSLAYTFVGVIGLTRWLGQRVTFETPLLALARIGWHELTAPRPDRREQHATMRPGRIKQRWEGVTLR